MGKPDRLELAVGPKQLVFLTMVAVMAAVAAFLCGVQMGRGLPAAAATVPAAGPPVAGVIGGPGPAAADPVVRERTRPRLDGLSYFERLRGAGSVPETLDFDAEAPAPAAAPPRAPGPSAPEGRFLVQVMSVRGAAAARRQPRPLLA